MQRHDTETRRDTLSHHYLINGARNETGHVLAALEDLRERLTEGGRRLYGGERDLADTRAVVEAEDAASLVERDALLNLADHFIERRLLSAKTHMHTCSYIICAETSYNNNYRFDCVNIEFRQFNSIQLVNYGIVSKHTHKTRVVM